MLLKSLKAASATTLTVALFLTAVPARAETPPIKETKATKEASQESSLKLYRLDCGQVHVSDLDVFSDTYQYVGQSKDLTVSCYVIRHGKNVLLWDTGLPLAIAEQKNGVTNGPFTLTIEKKLTDQLKEIGLSPDDVTHVGLSHGHFDHAGNVGLFKNAELIISKAEYEMMSQHPDEAKSYHMDPAHLGHFIPASSEEKSEKKTEPKVRLVEGNQDLFGDGLISTISLPGHTPGHMALLVKLKKSKPVILSGDQWHFNENRAHNGVPSFNYDRSDTLSSSDKLNAIVENLGATLLIQHESKDIAKTPTFPAFLE